jgi:hypothetical protein
VVPVDEVHLAVGVGDLAQAEELLAAEPAGAAGDHRGDGHAIAGPDAAHLGAGLLDDPDELVPEDVARVHVRHGVVIKVQVRAADAGMGHTHDGVRRLLQGRRGALLDLDALCSLPDDRLHGSLLIPVAADSCGSLAIPDHFP